MAQSWKPACDTSTSREGAGPKPTAGPLLQSGPGCHQRHAAERSAARYLEQKGARCFAHGKHWQQGASAIQNTIWLLFFFSSFQYHFSIATQ